MRIFTVHYATQNPFEQYELYAALTEDEFHRLIAYFRSRQALGVNLHSWRVTALPDNFLDFDGVLAKVEPDGYHEPQTRKLRSTRRRAVQPKVPAQRRKRR